MIYKIYLYIYPDHRRIILEFRQFITYIHHINHITIPHSNPNNHGMPYRTDMVSRGGILFKPKYC